MKAITLTQPWAALVSVVEKDVETRSWQTSYRGEIAIHAGIGLGPVGGKRGLIELCNRPYFKTSLFDYGLSERTANSDLLVPSSAMRFGAVVAVAELYDIEPTGTARHIVDEKERAFGDYSLFRYAWFLRNIRRLEKPVFVKGALGLWEWK